MGIKDFFNKQKQVLYEFKEDVLELGQDLKEDAIEVSYDIIIDLIKFASATEVKYPIIQVSLPFLPMGSFFLQLNNTKPQNIKKILDKWDKKKPKNKKELVLFFKELKPMKFQIKIGK